MTISKTNLPNTSTLLDQVMSRGKGTTTSASEAQRGAPDSVATPLEGVKLSPLSEKLKALSRELGANDIDQARVNELRHAISNGTYRINASAIADKMLADASLQRDK
jgi:negative regulator of flagellin synthesis FlgM